jgi:hypothetical protein
MAQQPGAMHGADAAKRQAVDVTADMMRLGVRISQNNYVPEVTY